MLPHSHYNVADKVKAHLQRKLLEPFSDPDNMLPMQELQVPLNLQHNLHLGSELTTASHHILL
jgi:hypothetical protein